MWLKVLYCSIPHIESPGVFYDTTQEITLNLAQIILIYYEPMQSVTISYCQKRASRVCSTLFFFFHFMKCFVDSYKTYLEQNRKHGSVVLKALTGEASLILLLKLCSCLCAIMLHLSDDLCGHPLDLLQ